MNQFRKTWLIPFLLALVTLFGLLAALLGTGIWTIIAWIAMLIPVAIMIWKVGAYRLFASRN